MKYLLLLSASLVLFSCSSNKKLQNVELPEQKVASPIATNNTINKDFNAYIGYIISKDFDKSMDYLLPEFFDLFPRETMIQVMEQTFNNPEIIFELKDPVIISVGESKQIEGKFYSYLRYSNIMDMKFVPAEDESAEDKEMRIQLTKGSLQGTFGADNITYSEETEFFNIYSEKDVIAISKNGINNWKFLVKEENQLPLLQQLVPTEVLEMK